MNNDLQPVRWTWEPQDRKWAIYALIWLAIIGAICTLHPGEYPALNHIADNAVNGATYIGVPACLLFAGARNDDQIFSFAVRIAFIVLGAAGIVAGVAFLAGRVV